MCRCWFKDQKKKRKKNTDEQKKIKQKINKEGKKDS